MKSGGGYWGRLAFYFAKKTLFCFFIRHRHQLIIPKNLFNQDIKKANIAVSLIFLWMAETGVLAIGKCFMTKQ